MKKTWAIFIQPIKNKEINYTRHTLIYYELGFLKSKRNNYLKYQICGLKGIKNVIIIIYAHNIFKIQAHSIENETDN